MAIVATIIPEVQDIVDNAAVRELFIVSKEMERPPYWHESEGLNARLAKALRVVQDGRITPNSDGSYTVEGSEHRTYRCAESCSCPQSQKAKSKWCYHLVAVALYVEWCRRLGYADQPALPLPPTTPDERLRHSVALGMAHDSTALSTPHTPQEDRMPDNADAYIPEPDAVPVATLERPDPATTAATPRPLPGPVLLPSLDARTLEQSMQAWSAQRQVVKRFLQQELVEGTDYYTLRIKGRETKPALSKAGSEKFLALFQLHATFEQDTATWTMLGSPQGTLCYRCQLHTRSGEIVGEGRGARTIQQDGGDINKAVKMGQKSACVDAILRTGALSDVFSQDLDDQPQTPAPAATPTKPSSQELRQRIWAMVTAQAPQQATTREAVTTWIRQVTGYELVPDNYATIVHMLETRACA